MGASAAVAVGDGGRVGLVTAERVELSASGVGSQPGKRADIGDGGLEGVVPGGNMAFGGAGVGAIGVVGDAGDAGIAPAGGCGRGLLCDWGDALLGI
jgi:hypothetical protein